MTKRQGELLAALRDASPGGATAKLCALLADDLLERAIGDLVTPRVTAEHVVKILAAGAAGPAAARRLTAPVLEWAETYRDDKQPLGKLVPPEIAGAARDLAAHGFTPDRKVVQALLASDPVHRFMREAMSEALMAYAKGTPMSGLVGLGKKMAEAAVARTGALGAAIERGTNDVVDTALAALLERVTDVLTDPRRARDQAALRRALVDATLGLRARDGAREGERARPLEIAEIVRRHASAWAARPEAASELEDVIVAALGDDLGRPARELLIELGVLAAVRAALVDGLGRALRPALHGEAFAAWLAELTGEARG
jgi:hypothetical protein